MNIKPTRTSRATRVLLVIFSLLVCTAPTSAVYGLSQNQINVFDEGIGYFNTEINDCSDSTSSLIGADNAQKIYNFLTGQGLSPIAAAGIIGNLYMESGLDPKIVEANPPYESDTLPPSILGKAGYGIAQWTPSGRQQGLIQAARQAGVPESDLQVQLNYLWTEATTTYSGVLARLKQATDTDTATQIWMGPNGFENPDPNKAHLAARQAEAKSVYQQYGTDQVVTASASCSSASTSDSNTQTGGTSTDFATNFVFYKQCIFSDSTKAENQAAAAWANARYGDTIVCDGGCGPTSMAMIITNLTKQRVTPDMTAAYGAAHGTESGGESNTAMLGPVIGGHWGLKSTYLGFDINKIDQVLKNGGLVIADGHAYTKAANDHGPFSEGGHIVVIRALTSDGKWLIGNPGGWPDNTVYDPSWIVKNDYHLYAWGLTK